MYLSILSVVFALLSYPSSWQPIFEEDSLEITCKMESCESSDYIFFKITNSSSSNIAANFDLVVKDEAGLALFTFSDWYIDVSPGTYSNECGQINDNILAVLLPKRLDNVTIHLIKKP